MMLKIQLYHIALSDILKFENLYFIIKYFTIVQYCIFYMNRLLLYFIFK